MPAHRRKCFFALLPPDALAIMADLIGQRLPLFMFTNRVSFKMTLQGQLHVYETQRLSVVRQILAIESQSTSSNFELSEESRYEMDSITKE